MENPGRAARSAILTWHSLDDSGSVVSTPPSVFRRQIESLCEASIPVVPLEEIRGSSGSVALTFDDGYANLADHAFPLLERLGLPATVFAVSRYCGLSNQWPGQPAGSIPDLPLLSWEQLRALPPEITIGAHTASHPHLTELPTEECDRELRECRDEIEQRLSRRVGSLAYPYGDCSDPVRRLAGRYFSIAAGTSFNFLSQDSNLLDLPRLDMYYFRDRSSLGSLFGPAAGMYIGLRGILRDVRARISG